jgi:hypothetical protein
MENFGILLFLYRKTFSSHRKLFKVSLPSIGVTFIGILNPAMFWWFESPIPDF